MVLPLSLAFVRALSEDCSAAAARKDREWSEGDGQAFVNRKIEEAANGGNHWVQIEREASPGVSMHAWELLRDNLVAAGYKASMHFTGLMIDWRSYDGEQEG